VAALFHTNNGLFCLKLILHLFLFYFSALSVTPATVYSVKGQRGVGCRKNKTWTEVVVAQFKDMLSNMPRDTEKIHEKIVRMDGAMAKFVTSSFLSASQKRRRFDKLRPLHVTKSKQFLQG